MQDGETVVALDTGPQRSLAGWGQRREANGVAVERVEMAAIKGTLDRLRRDRATSLAIIDTPSYFGAGVAPALREANLCLLPVMADRIIGQI